MMTNAEIVSRVINDINAIKKDMHVSRRYVLSILRQKAKTWIARRWDEGGLYREASLFTTIECLEMVPVNKIDCCFDTIPICDTIYRSKYKIPELLYSRLGPAILLVSSVNYLNGDVTFDRITIRQHNNIKSRLYADLDDNYYYYIWDDYIYIPMEIEAITVLALTLDPKKAKEISGCGKEDEDKCKSQWDYDFICPDKLVEYVIGEALQEITGTKVQIPIDENPNMDINQKTQIIQ